MLKLLCWMDRASVKVGDFIAPIIDFGVRFYLAKIFFLSALTKISSWETTLTLFKYEYAVPLLPSNVAAYLGTGAELILPVMLVLGLGSRITPLALFIFNLVAMFSYPDISQVGFDDHIVWGLLLATLIAHGHGKLSLDALIKRWLCK